MWWWGDQEAAGLKGFVADSVKKYEAANPSIKINTTLQSTDNLVPAFEAAAAAKKGPDIEYFWGGINTLEDGWAGNIKPISDLLPQSEWKHYINGGEDTSGGKLYTAPWYIQPSFPVLYRKDVLARGGHRRGADDVDAAARRLQDPAREGHHADGRRRQGRLVRRLAVQHPRLAVGQVGR